MRSDVVSGIVDATVVEIAMSQGIVGNAVAVLNTDIGRTINIG